MALQRGIGRNEWVQSFDQLGDVTTGDLPYPVDIDLKIVMDHDIPKKSNGDILNFRAEVRRERRNRRRRIRSSRLRE